MKKLVLFGDSLFGRCSKRHTVLLEAKLNGQYDVYNCANGGWDTNDLVKKSPFIAKLQPDVVVISVGTNDASPWKRVELEKFKENLAPIADAFAGSRIVFFPPPPVREVSRLDGKPIPNTDMKLYNQAIVDFCKSRKINYLNSWDVFMALQDRGKSYHVEDGVHLSDEGYDILFDVIAKELS